MNNHYYAGSCVDLFDAEGMALGVLPYEDVTEFAQAVETCGQFPMQKFVSSVAFLNQWHTCYTAPR